MTEAIPRERLERYAAALQELRRRELRREFARPGGFIKFVEYMWSVLEPGTPFVRGWAMDAIAEHLEAVSSGKINKLLVNVPPGFSKSMLVMVFWPLWEWACLGRGQERYVTFAYAAHLTERDNRRMLTLIRSSRFRDLYPEAFTLLKQGEELISNDKMGWKLATSVGGVGTGERGSRILCIEGSQVVQTEFGLIPIDQIVSDRLGVRVWGVDVATGKKTLRKIKRFYKNPGSAIVEVGLSDGSSLKCTPNHEVWTSTRGWVMADSLLPSDVLPSFARQDASDCRLGNAKLPSRPSLASGPVAYFGNLIFGQLGLLYQGSARAIGLFSQPISYAAPGLASSDLANDSGADAELICKGVRWIGALSDLGGLFSSQLSSRPILKNRECAVNFGIRDVVRSRTVTKIFKRVKAAISVLMPNLLSWFGRSDEGQHNRLMHKDVVASSPSACVEASVALPVAWRLENFPPIDQQMSVAHRGSRFASDAAQVGNTVESLKAGDRSPLFVRFAGHVAATYCLEVDVDHTFICGGGQGIVVSNCDDPHNVAEGESDAVRTSTVNWFRESISDRLNNMATGAIVIIMQRVHEQDVSGTILSVGMDYCHLCIPMEYDPDRHCATAIGWEDPRTERGQLAWEERFPAPVVSEIKIEKGPYAYSGQYQQRPSPRGGGIIKRDWWQLWDSPDGRFPPLSLVIASADTAYTEKEQNDPTGFTVWGVWSDNGQPKLMLLNAWRKRLQLHGEDIPRLPQETTAAYEKRAMKHWGLCEWIAHSCRRFKADIVLIENKASGISVAQELRRLHASEPWQVHLRNPEGDKVARAYAVQSLFSQGLIYAPDREWAEMVISEAETFPKGLRDLTDSATQALKWLRDQGILIRKEERVAAEIEKARFRPAAAPLYDV